MRLFFLSVSLLSFTSLFAQGGEGNHTQGTRTRPQRQNPEVDCGSDLEYDKESDLVLHAKSLAPFTGMCRSYYEDSRLEREVNFVDGKEDGVSTTYYQRKGKDDDPDDPKPGHVMVITEHKMGSPNGTWKYFYESGKVAWVNTYKEGKKDGTWEYFYDDQASTPKKEENWKDDKKNGVFKEYFKNGQVKLEINYKDNVLEGSYKMFFEDGKPFIESKYLKGKEDGESISYHKNGQMASLKRFKLGKAEGTWRYYFEDGREKSVESYLNGVKVGEHKEYYKEGQLKKRAVYVEGKLTLLEEFDEYGNKIDREAEKKKKEEESKID